MSNFHSATAAGSFPHGFGKMEPCGLRFRLKEPVPEPNPEFGKGPRKKTGAKVLEKKWNRFWNSEPAINFPDPVPFLGIGALELEPREILHRTTQKFLKFFLNFKNFVFAIFFLNF